MSPLLTSRLLKALDYYKNNPNVKFIVSGNKSFSESNLTEADAMFNYLVKHNVNKNNIIIENYAHNTLENMTFSNNIIKKDWNNKYLKPLVGFITNDYHSLRSNVYANKINLSAVPITVNTPSKYLIYAFPKEIMAFLVNDRYIFTLLIIISLLIKLYYK